MLKSRQSSQAGFQNCYEIRYKIDVIEIGLK
jgi:hypothetical protein